MPNWSALSGVVSKLGIIHRVGSIIPQAQVGVQAADSSFTAGHSLCLAALSDVLTEPLISSSCQNLNALWTQRICKCPSLTA